MYAWIWRHLPGQWQSKTAVAAGLVLVACLVLWYAVFPWLEQKVRFDHGVVQPGPSGSAAPTRTTVPGG